MLPHKIEKQFNLTNNILPQKKKKKEKKNHIGKNKQVFRIIYIYTEIQFHTMLHFAIKLVFPNM